MKIEGHITIWFNANSNFKMEFNRVSVPEALEMLQLIRRNLQTVEPLDVPYGEQAEPHEQAQEGA